MSKWSKAEKRSAKHYTRSEMSKKLPPGEFIVPVYTADFKYNKIIAIGFRSGLQCYIDWDREKAIDHYCKSNELSRAEFDDWIQNEHHVILEVEAKDGRFDAYDIEEAE